MRAFFLCLISLVSSIGLGGCTGLTEADSGYDYRHYGFARPDAAYGYRYGSAYRYPRYVYVPYTRHPWDRRWRRFDHEHHVHRDHDRDDDDRHRDHDRRRHERRDDGHHADGWGADRRRHGSDWRGPVIDRPGIERGDHWGPPSPGRRRFIEDEERGQKMQPVPRIVDQLEAQGYSRIEPKKRRGRTLSVTAEDKQGGKSVLVIDRQTGRLIERPQVRR